MSNHERKPFKLAEGVNVYEPELSTTEIQFLQLFNVDARLARLMASRGYSLFQDLSLSESDKITGFGYYSLSTRQYHSFYAFSKTKVFFLDFEAGQFDTTPIYEFDLPSDTAPVIIPWFDCMYVTRPEGPYVRIEYKTVTVVTDAPSARYGIIANSHAMLGNVGDSSSRNLARIRWSDLDAPESFELDPNQSEADFFDLEPSSLAITGMSYQRGVPLIYSQNDIWGGTYRGFPESFKFEPLFSGLGNIFHDSVIRNKDVDYFIGADNFYELNGLQPVAIGDKIFKRFIENVKIGAETSVRGYLDSRKLQVFWVYTDNSDVLRSVVFNYKERRWTERDPQDITAWFDTPRVTFRGYQVIDDIPDIIDTDSDLIDDPNAGFPLILPQLVGTRAAGGGGGPD